MTLIWKAETLLNLEKWNDKRTWDEIILSAFQLFGTSFHERPQRILHNSRWKCHVNSAALFRRVAIWRQHSTKSFPNWWLSRTFRKIFMAMEWRVLLLFLLIPKIIFEKFNISMARIIRTWTSDMVFFSYFFFSVIKLITKEFSFHFGKNIYGEYLWNAN